MHGEEHGAFVDSYSAVLAKSIAHYYNDCINADWEGILGGIKDKDANCYNDEPVETVIDTSVVKDNNLT